MAVPLVLVAAMERGMARCLARSREQTLTTLRARSSVLVAAGGDAGSGDGPAHVASPDTVFDPATWEANVKSELAPVVEAVVVDSAARTAVGTAFDVENPAMAAAVDSHVAAIASWGESFRNTVSTTVTQGMHDGLSNDAIAAKLQEAGPLSDKRAITIARTETTAAANAGTLQAWQGMNEGDTPVVQSKTWMATMDDRTRPDHADADGQEVPLDQPFYVGFEACKYPGDPDLPPEQRVNCRCSMLSGDGTEISADDAETNPPDEAALPEGDASYDPTDELTPPDEGDQQNFEDVTASYADTIAAEESAAPTTAELLQAADTPTTTTPAQDASWPAIPSTRTRLRSSVTPKQEDAMTAAASPWVASLPQNYEDSALDKWGAGGYVDIRAQIASGKPLKVAKEFQREIAGAPDHTGITYRGWSGVTDDLGTWKSRATEGKTMTWDAPSSASLNPAIAGRFAGGDNPGSYGGYGKPGVIFEIKGTGKFVAPALTLPEHEVIMPTGRYRVVGAYQGRVAFKPAPINGPKSSLRTIVRLEQLPPERKP